MPIVTISDARGAPLRWTGRADPQSVGTVRQLLVARAAELGADGDLRDRVALAVSEAMSNVVVHAYRDAPEPGEVTARLVNRDATLEISIRDRGVGLVPRADSPGLGFGLGLMARCAQAMDIRTPPEGGVEVLLSFLLPAHAGPAARAA
jgi:anti-sigma regulatory factor (Ser/Thr protein kinase)